MSQGLKRLLVVDDEPELLEVMIFGLESMGYDCFAADSAKAALELLRKETVDLVISDMRMPGGDGVELLEQMQKNLSQVPKLIFLSGYTDYSEKDLLSKGAQALVKKPISMEDLNKHLQAIFNSQSL